MAYEVFLDSFENWVGNSSSNWVFVEGSPTTHFAISPTEGRFNNYCLKSDFTAAPYSSRLDRILTASSSIVCGFSYKRYKYVSSTQNQTVRFRFKNSTTTLVELLHKADGKFQITLGGTTYISNNSLALNQTAHIQIGTVIGDSGSFELRVNGSSIGWLNLSNVDTKPSTQNTADAFEFFNILDANAYQAFLISDFWIAYGNELKWFGDCQVKKLSLSGNATPQDFIPDTGNAWERLNQVSGNVTSVTTGAESLFELADLTDNIASVEALVINMTAKKTTSNSRTIVIEANSNNSISNSSVISLGNSPTEYKYTLINEPSSNSSWTKEAVNNLKIGFKNV